MALPEILDVSMQAANALQAAQAAGIVHRDIKPDNIMLRPDGIVKVLDFGLAKLTEKSRQSSLTPVDSQINTMVRAHTRPGTVMGTIDYMSPEQARGQVLDERTDVFSFGVVLYEMAAGGSLASIRVEMWKQKHWQSPYYWSAFTMQGEWR